MNSALSIFTERRGCWGALFLLSTVLLSSLLLFSADAQTPAQLKPDESFGPVASKIGYLREQNGEYSLEEVQKRENEFTANAGNSVSFGLGAAPAWLRMSVENSAETPGKWVLALNRYMLSSAEIYMVRNGQSKILLDMRDRSETRRAYERFGMLATYISLEAGETANIYVYYQGANSSMLSPEILTEVDYKEKRHEEVLFFGVVLGCIAMLFLYNLVLYLSTRLNIYLFYLGAQIFSFAYYAHLKGFTTVYLWPLHPEWGRDLTEILGGLQVVSMLIFVKYFLNIGNKSAFVSRLITGIVTFFFVVYLPMCWIENSLPSGLRKIWHLLGYLNLTFTWLVLSIVGIYAALRWTKEAWPLAIGWVISSLPIFYSWLIYTGAVPITPLWSHIYGVVSVVDAFTMSVALALYVGRIRAEALSTQAALTESLASQLEESRKASRLAEEKAAALQGLAEKGRLLQAAGHDARQILSGLRHFAHSFRTRNKDQNAAMTADLMTRMTDELELVLSTSMDGAYASDIGDVTLAIDTVKPEAILNPLRLIFQAEAARKKIDLRFAGHDVSFATDRALLLRMLSNLVSNAIKYTPEHGKIIVICRAIGKRLVFSVRDNGSGLDHDWVARINQGLQLHQRRGNETESGLGSGLTIVQNLVRRLDGDLQVISEPGRGSRFEILLPMPLDETDLPHHCIALPDKDSLQTKSIERLLTSMGVEFALLPENNLADRDITHCLLDVSDGHGEKNLAFPDDWPGMKIGLLYDRSADIRSRFSGQFDMLLYKPLSVESVRFLITKRKTMPSGK